MVRSFLVLFKWCWVLHGSVVVGGLAWLSQVEAIKGEKHQEVRVEEEGGGVTRASKGVSEKARSDCRGPQSVLSLGTFRGMIAMKAGGFGKATSVGLGDSGGGLGHIGPVCDGCKPLDLGLLKDAHYKLDKEAYLG